MSAGLPLQLAPMNARLAAFGELPAQAVHEWLWGTDPEEPYHVDVLLNRNQLLGLMVCRHKFLRGRVLCSESTYFAAQHRLTIMDKPVQQMTWRELKDTVANILIEWPSFLERLSLNIRAKQNLRQVLHLVNLCAMRFGELAYTTAGQDVLDDLPETQPHKSGDGKLTLTAGGLRRMVGSLLIMYRHLYLLSMCIKVPPQAFDPQLTKYHYEASNDAFNLLCMHMTLPVAARLNYRHDFPGMYNHVSQVLHLCVFIPPPGKNNTLMTLPAGSVLSQQPVQPYSPPPTRRRPKSARHPPSACYPRAIPRNPASIRGG